MALVLGLAFAAGPIATPAHADCAAFTLLVNWHGTDPTGRPTTPVHEGCVTETDDYDGSVTVSKNQTGTFTPPGMPSSVYVYVYVPAPTP